MLRFVLALSVALTLLVPHAAAQTRAEAQLSRPEGLERDIEFWRKVFSEISTRQGFIHDDRRLDIIYETIELPADHTPAERRREARAAARRYAGLLRGLAKGTRRELSDDEQRILELWGPDVDPQTLLEAADRVRFQLGQSDRFREGLVRSGRWADHIERTLAEAGVPSELIALPHVESAFDPRARSRAGAAGLWQFIPSTGRRYLQIDNLLDERLDPFRSTEAAALLLRHNHAVTGSWPTAITAYNHGVAGMQRAIRRLGTNEIETLVRNYDGRAFGFASRNFYVSFLAALDVRENAERYFGNVEREPPDDSRALKLPAYAPLGELAAQLGVDDEALARLNPSLRQPVWDGSKHVPKGYVLRVPGGQERSAEQLLAAIPERLWHQDQIPDVYHVVQRGETLSAIAPRYGASVREIVGLNGLSSPHRIRAGQRLILPGAAEVASEAAVDDGGYPDDPAPAPARASATPTAVAATADMEHAAAAGPPSEDGDGLGIELPTLAADPNDYSVGAGGFIQVHEGESLGHYAHWLELRTQRLRDRNGLGFHQSIHVGSKLRLDFANVTPEEFERRRIEHHREMQERFFGRHRIEGTKEHVIERGESVWVVAGRRYGVPVWLLRQYNPELDLARVRPGTRVVVPKLESIDT